MAPFVVNASLVLRDDTREKFLSIIHDDQTKTLETEPGALQFVIGEDVEDPNKFYLHEQYISKEDFDAHCKTPHFAVWEEFCKTSPFAEGGEPLPFFFNGDHEPKKVPVRSAHCLNINVYVKPESRDELLNVIGKIKKGAETEAGCLQYVFGESTETPNTFHLHEEYDGKEGFNAHCAEPGFAEWLKFAETDPFTKPPEAGFFNTC